MDALVASNIIYTKVLLLWMILPVRTFSFIFMLLSFSRSSDGILGSVSRYFSENAHLKRQ